MALRVSIKIIIRDCSHLAFGMEDERREFLEGRGMAV